MDSEAILTHTTTTSAVCRVDGYCTVRILSIDDSHRKELEMAPTSALGAAAPRTGDEIKRAVILSSETRVDASVRDFQRLQELQSVLGQLEQLRTRHAVSDQQLHALEQSTERQSQRALVLHARIERVLAVYHEMISSLSSL